MYYIMHISIMASKGPTEPSIHVQSRRELNVPYIALEVISGSPLLQEHEDHRDQIRDKTSQSRWFRGDHLAHLFGTFVMLLNICPSDRFIVCEQLLHRPRCASA